MSLFVCFFCFFLRNNFKNFTFIFLYVLWENSILSLKIFLVSNIIFCYWYENFFSHEMLFCYQCDNLFSQIIYFLAFNKDTILSPYFTRSRLFCVLSKTNINIQNRKSCLMPISGTKTVLIKVLI